MEEDQVFNMSKITLKIWHKILNFGLKYQEKEDMAWQMAEIIIKDVLAITSGKRPPQAL